MVTKAANNKYQMADSNFIIKHYNILSSKWMLASACYGSTQKGNECFRSHILFFEIWRKGYLMTTKNSLMSGKYLLFIFWEFHSFKIWLNVMLLNICEWKILGDLLTIWISRWWSAVAYANVVCIMCRLGVSERFMMKLIDWEVVWQNQLI